MGYILYFFLLPLFDTNKTESPFLFQIITINQRLKILLIMLIPNYCLLAVKTSVLHKTT